MAPPDENTSNPIANARPGEGASLSERLAATRRSLATRIGRFLSGKRILDAEALAHVEDLLLGADIGVEATDALLRDLNRQLAAGQLSDGDTVQARLREGILEILQPCSEALVIKRDRHPFVIMVLGVNGVGKTTTIGKLAQRLKDTGYQVMVAAADTFRAAAVEQIQAWGKRVGVPVIAQHTGADAAAVAHDALQAARARGVEVLLIDTAGRQHTNIALMDEIRKIERVLRRLDPEAPHEILLVLDAVTGQNALSQLAHFREAVKVTGICMTKLDGTAKGGILIALARTARLPIRFIGVGEGAEDLREFDAAEFVQALFSPGPQNAGPRPAHHRVS